MIGRDKREADIPGVSSARMEFQMSQKPLCGNVPLWLASHFLYLYLPGPEEFPRSRHKIMTAISCVVSDAKQVNLNNQNKHSLWQSPVYATPPPIRQFPCHSSTAASHTRYNTLGLPKWLFWHAIFHYLGKYPSPSVILSLQFYFFLISEFGGKLTYLQDETFREIT